VLEACEQELNLINLVRQQPALYDSRHKRFHDDTHKEQLWKSITTKLNIELTQCLVTWSELRYRYQRHVRRLRAFHRSSVQRKGPTRRRPCLRYEEELHFLYPHVARFPLLTVEDSDNDGEGEGDNGAPEVEIVEPPPVDIIDVDLVEDASSFRCSSGERRLIEAVSAYSQLYDPLHIHYANYRHRGLIWSSISNELHDKATKLIKIWLKLMTRYEWEITINAGKKESEICQLMNFMRTSVLRMHGTVCQSSKYLQTGWHEPIENFRSVLALINAMRSMPELVQLMDDSQKMKTKPAIYDDLWLKVGKAVTLGHERCEVTWLVLRSFHTELTVMRQEGYQLQDKWYFENMLNGILRLVANRAAKRGNKKRPHNGDATEEEMAQPPAKIAAPEPPAPPRLPIAIVYPPAMKNSSNASSAAPPPPPPSDIPHTSFVIPTIHGNVRVSTLPPVPPVPRLPVKLPSSITAKPVNQPPNAVRPLLQRPGIQISVRPKNATPSMANVPISLSTAIIRAIPPPAPPAQAATFVRPAAPGAKPKHMKIIARIPTLPTRKPSKVAPPMVRIHQQAAEDVGITLPGLTGRTGAAVGTMEAGAGRGIGGGRAAEAGGGMGAGAGKGGGAGAGVELGTGAGTGAGASAGAGSVTSRGANGGVGTTAAAAAVVTIPGIYPEIPSTSSGVRASVKTLGPTIIRATGTSLPTVVLPGSTTTRIGISKPPEATSMAPPVPPVTRAAPSVAKTALPVASPAATVTAATLPVTTLAPAASPVTIAAPAAHPVTIAAPAAHPVTIAAPAASPVTIAASADTTATSSPPINPEEEAEEESPSTSRSIPTDFGQSPPGIFMNAINVNLVHSSSAGNSLRIWGGGLTCNYHLNMVRAATLIREVMAVPQLHNRDPRLKAQADGFWQIISQKFHLPELALRACWNFLANNMSIFPSIAPMSELMRPFKGNLKVWEKSTRLFDKFDEIARKNDWIKHREVIPQLIRYFRQHEHFYWEMRKPRPGEPVQSPPLFTEKDRQEVWREAKIKFPDLNHHDIWSMFKFAFRTYMEDLERGIDNAWPQIWWQVLEQLKFLADVRYHPLEPYYYIVHNKILDEVKRCSIFEALTSSDCNDKSKTSALLARVCKEPMPWCSEEAKRLLTGKLSTFEKVKKPKELQYPVPVAVANEAVEEVSPPVEEAQPSHSRNLLKRTQKPSGSRPSFTVPTIEAFELTRMLRRYPHTFQRVHTINKRTAWVRVSKELNITVTECRLGLQYALREMRFLKALDPKNLCTMNHKYYRNMDEIYKQVTSKPQLTVRTPEQMNESVSEAAVELPEEVMPHHFVPEINMSTSKPSLVVKNWASAVGNLPSESQDVLAIKLKYLFAKYAKMGSHNN
ncbi:hypothetical protein KR059_004905, partial [Drosophila kikkawai]